MADPLFSFKFSVEIFPDKVNQLLNSPNGPVGLLVQDVAEDVLQRAKQNIGERRFSGHHPGPSLADAGQVEQTGGAARIVTFSKRDNTGRWDVALLHHEGTTSHPIGAPGKFLIRNEPLPAGNQPWNVNGFFARQEVTHPGTEGNPYLTDAADAAGLRRSGTLLRGQRPAQVFRLRQP